MTERADRRMSNDDEAASDATEAPARELAPLWLLGGLSLLFSLFFMLPLTSYDFWWHISLGKVIWQTGSVPTVDTLSYLAYGEKVGYIGWLADVLFYGLYINFGSAGVVGLKMACGFVMLGSVSWIMHQLETPKLVAVVSLMLTALLLTQRFNMARPFIIGGAFTLLLLAMVFHTYRTQRLGPLACVPVLAAVWIACHGTALVLYGVLVVLAIALVLSRAPYRLAAKVLGIALLSAVPLLATRTGLDMLAHARSKENVREIMSVIAEWSPLDVTGYHVWAPWLFTLLGLTIALTRDRENIRDWWLPLGLMASTLFFYLTMNYRGEHQGLLFMIYPMLLGLTELAGWLERKNPSLAPVIAALLPVALLPLAPPVFPEVLGAQISYVYPHKTLAKLLELPPGRLAHRFGMGGYFMWHGVPGGVFGDGRTAILFDDSHWRNYWRLLDRREDGFNDVANELGIRYVIALSFTTTRENLEGHGWRVIHESDEGALLERPESLGPAPTSFENAPPMRVGAGLWLEGEEVPNPLELLPPEGRRKMLDGK